MSELSDNALAAVGLCSTEGIGLSTVRRLQRWSRLRGVPLWSLHTMSPSMLVSEAGLSPRAARIVAGLPDSRDVGRAAIWQLAAAGGRVLVVGRAGYPNRLLDRLGEQAPPVLFALGDATALSAGCIAIVGSREPTRAAVHGAGQTARALAGALVTVVSGGARGIDMTAHRAAIQAGATAVVPAMGLWRSGLGWLRAAASGEARWCVLSEFPPQAGWRAAHALIRNRTIVGLCDAVLAFEPRDSGGTWRTCLHALKLRVPLLVASASGQRAKRRGLNRLVRMGAVALDPCHMPDVAALADLIADYAPPPALRQGALFAGA